MRKLHIVISAFIPAFCNGIGAQAADTAFHPNHRIGMRRIAEDYRLKYARNIVRSQDVRPHIGPDGTKLYYIASLGPVEAPWEAVVTCGSYGPPERLTDNRRNELAVVPSPDEKKLLLLVQAGETGCSLVVADRNGNDLAVVAKGIDPARSRFAWRCDGACVYYTVPHAQGRGMVLRQVTSDGRSTTSLFDRDVRDFDVCRTKDRLIVTGGSTVVVLDGGKRTRICRVDGNPEYIRLAADGNSASWSDGHRIVVFDLENESVVTCSSPPEEGVLDRMPALSPDGSRIAFQREYYRKDAPGITIAASLIVMQVVNGAEQEDKRRDFLRDNIQWSPLGDVIVYDELPIDSVATAPVLSFAPVQLKETPSAGPWQRTNGPYGGARLRAYAVSPSSDKVLYAALDQMGVYVTTDGGDSWEMIDSTDHVYANSVNALAVDSADPQIVYAGIHNEVRRNLNAGPKWEYYSGQSNRFRVNHLISHQSKPGVLFSLCDGKRRVLKFTRREWSELVQLENGAVVERLELDPRNHDLLIVHDRRGVLTFSSDAGKNWREPTLPRGERALPFLTGCEGNKDILFAQGTSRAAYFSNDNGASWEPYANPKVPGLWTQPIRRRVAEIFPLLLPGEQGETREGSGFDRFGPRRSKPLYKAVGAGIQRSVDGGRTWHFAAKGLGAGTIHSVQPLPYMPKGLVITSGTRIMTSPDGGETWNTTKPGEIATWDLQLTPHPHKPGLFFAYDKHVTLLRSADYGRSWEIILQQTHDGNEGLSRVLGQMNRGTGRQFEFDRNNIEHILLYTAGGVLESTDGGRKWNTLAEYTWPGQHATLQPLQIVGNEHAITIGRKWKRSIFQTRDRGKTWHRLSGPFKGHRNLGMLGKPGVPGALYVLTKQKDAPVLWISSDFGNTWEARILPDSDYEPYSFTRNPANPDMLAVGIGRAVWLSRDDGKSWEDLGQCVHTGSRPIKTLAFSPADNRLYAVILKTGLFWLELPPVK